MVYVKEERQKGGFYFVMQESSSIVGDYRIYRSKSKSQCEYVAEKINKRLLKEAKRAEERAKKQQR